MLNLKTDNITESASRKLTANFTLYTAKHQTSGWCGLWYVATSRISSSVNVKF